MATETGPLRLHAPTASMYDTSAGETAVLRGLTPETIGMMLPFLRSQEINQQNRQDQYGGLLESLNRQQRAIAASKLQNDRREMDHKSIGMLVQHAGMGAGPALNGLNLEGLPAYLSTQQAQMATANTDLDRRMLDQSKAFQAVNDGLFSGVRAGVNIDPGQVAGPGAAGRLNLRATTGTPLSLQEEALRAAGRAGERDASSKEVKATWIPGTDETQYQLQGSAETIVPRMNALRLQQQQIRDAEVNRAGGNDTRPQGSRGAATIDRNAPPRNNQGNPVPTPAPGAGRTTGTASGANANISPTVRASLEARIGEIKNYFRDASGRLTAIGTRGNAPVPER